MQDSRPVLARTSDALVRYCTILLAFLIPFFVIPAAWASVPQAKVLLGTVLIVVALIAWLIGIVSGRRIVFSFDPILVAAFLIPLAYAASAYFSGSTYSSFVSGDGVAGPVASMIMLFGAALIGALAVEDRKHSLTAVFALLVSSAIVVVFQLVRLFLPGQLDLFGALAGNTSSVVGTWHDLSIFMGLALLVSLSLLETSIAAKTLLKILLQILALISFALLVIINFADTWYAVAGASVLFAVACALRSYRREQSTGSAIRSAVLWLILAVVSGAAAYEGTFIYNHLPAAVQVSQVEVRPSWQGTFQAGQQLFQGGKALVFGSGPNTFDQQWALFKPKEVNATNFWNTDFQSGIGVVPTALITVGVVGTLGWLLLALALLWAGYTSFKDENEGRLRVILFVGCAFLLAFHIFYVPSIGVSILMFLLLGILAGLNADSWREGLLSLSVPSITVFILILVIACATIAGALMESRAVVSTLYTTDAAVMYQKNQDLPAAAGLIARAISIDPQNDVAQRAAIEVGLLQFAKLAQGGSTDTATRDQLQKTLSNTIAHGLSAVSIDNTNYQNWLALAGLYQTLAGQGIQGAYQQATSAWQHAASTTPSNPLPLLQLGQIALAQGQGDIASGYLSKAITLKPDLALPYYLRSQIEANKASWQSAVQDAAAAAQLANQDPLGWYNLGVILYAGGDATTSAQSLEKAVSLQNNYSDALFALAVIYDKLGIHDQAILAAQKVVSLNANNATATAVLQNLQNGLPALSGQNGQPAQPPQKSQTPSKTSPTSKKKP